MPIIILSNPDQSRPPLSNLLCRNVPFRTSHECVVPQLVTNDSLSKVFINEKAVFLYSVQCHVIETKHSIIGNSSE